MAKIAFVFSGQGAQYSGMGKELYQISSAAKAVFDQADKIRPGTSGQCFAGEKDELAQTINTQPCVYCVDLAAAYALQEAGIHPQALAGFSLGEIAALTFSQTFDLKSGFEFVCKRAALMHEATQESSSTMVAVLKMDPEQLDLLCRSFEGVYPVNYNAPGQIVVALSEAMKAPFSEAVAAKGGRALPLAVSGAFHSPYMDSAKKGLEKELADMSLAASQIPVFSNYQAKPYPELSDQIKETIARQVNSPVYWQTTIENMVTDGIDTFIEVGPGKTLYNLIKKIAPNVRVLQVENAQTMKDTVEQLS